LKELGFPVAKGGDKFIENYELSDRAAVRGDALLRANGLESVQFGEDRRYERVWEAGEDRPDRKVRRAGRDIALLDWKGKKKDDWMMNERAYNAYLKWGERLGLPVYVAIWSDESNDGRFIRLPSRTISRKEMWDKNMVVIFEPREMRPWKNLPAELNAL
jgi:hypothetical protein